MEKTNNRKYAKMLLTFCAAAIFASCTAAPAGSGQARAPRPVGRYPVRLA